jgi:hypothetical protein
MATVVTCPECDTTLKLMAEPSPGKKVKCPKCATIFAPQDQKSRRVTAERPAAPAPARARPGRADEEDEDDDRDEEERRPRRPRRKQGGSGLLIGLLVGGGLLALLVVCDGVAALALYRGARSAGPNSRVPPAVAQQNGAGQGKGAPADAAQPNPAAPENPAAQPNPGAQAAAPAAGGDAPPGLYGDQGGEEVAAADPSLPDTLLRARAQDTFYKLSNARLGRDRFGQPSIAVDYEVTKEGQYQGATMIIHGADGSRATVLLFGPLKSHGTLEAAERFRGPFGAKLPEDLEIYLIRGDARYGPQAPTFKVSNSATIGMMTKRTRARNWTKEEIARLSQPPPNYSNPNAHPNVGQDTPFVGDTTGGIPNRYVEPQGLLLGLDYRTGEWEGEKCLGGLVPVFGRDQPVGPGMSRVLAKDGYAVGGVKVRTKRFVDAFQLVYMRVKPDGRLDAADSYTSDWFGDPGEQEAKTLAGDGTPVIGIICRQGGILNGLALVLRKG